MTTTKKESKKKKKKNAEKGDKTNGKKIDFQTENKDHDNNDNARVTESLSDNMCTRKAHKSTGNKFLFLQCLSMNLACDLLNIILCFMVNDDRLWILSISYVCDCMVIRN